jgi:hypothetical protein
MDHSLCHGIRDGEVYGVRDLSSFELSQLLAGGKQKKTQPSFDENRSAQAGEDGEAVSERQALIEEFNTK